MLYYECVSRMKTKLFNFVIHTHKWSFSMFSIIKKRLFLVSEKAY